MEKLEICGRDIVHECKVNYNGIEAANSKVNNHKNGIRHQYEIDIGKNKVKTFIDYQKSSVMRMLVEVVIIEN
ncbi:39859_t:CDS:1, partial [Gigaspora margarita]